MQSLKSTQKDKKVSEKTKFLLKTCRLSKSKGIKKTLKLSAKSISCAVIMKGSGNADSVDDICGVFFYDI